MKEIVAIARNTFKEAIRNRILYVILMFALVLIVFSGAVSELTISSREKIIKDMGFMAINLFGVAIAVFVGVSLVYNELEKKTIYTIVSKPIGRWQFLLGKYFGLLMTVWFNVIIMSFFFLISLHYHSAVGGDDGFMLVFIKSVGKALLNMVCWNAYDVTNNVMLVIFVTLLEMAIITSFAVLYSSFSTPTLSMFFTILTFMAGRMNEDIVNFTSTMLNSALKTAAAEGIPYQDALSPSYYFAQVASHLMPNLGVFHRTVDQAIYETTLSIPWVDGVGYGVLYTAGILCLSILIFNRRNFK